MSGHCEDVCTPDTMVCALVHGSIREVRRGWQSQKSLIFMHFHGVFLGSQHEIWSKQHNGKVSGFCGRPMASEGESDSRRDSLLLHDRETTFRRLMGAQITSTIST